MKKLKDSDLNGVRIHGRRKTTRKADNIENIPPAIPLHPEILSVAYDVANIFPTHINMPEGDDVELQLDYIQAGELPLNNFPCSKMSLTQLQMTRIPVIGPQPINTKQILSSRKSGLITLTTQIIQWI
jgi:hypothetical protein